MKTRPTLQGILPPIPTPFINDELSTVQLQDNIKLLSETALSGFLVLGSNGEAVLLSAEEKRLLLTMSREAIPGDRIMMVGAGAESSRETIKLVEMAASEGADCVLVITPSFFKGAMTQEALRQHYLKVADQARVPVLLYSVPQFTGVSLLPETVGRLAEHENIIGMKDSSGNMSLFADLVAAVPETFAMLVGNANTLLTALSLGAKGGIVALANVLPKACIRVQTLWNEGKIEEARKLQLRLNPLSTAVTSTHGVSGLKAAMDLSGLYGGPCRSPLLPLSQDGIRSIKSLLTELNDER